MKVQSLIFGVSSVLFLCGCATTKMYEGDSLSRDKVAVIKGGSDLDFISKLTASIQSVDGTKLGKTSTSVEVLPGKHTIMAKCTNMGGGLVESYSNNEQTHTVEVEAGKTYKLAVGIDSKGCTTKIIDESEI